MKTLGVLILFILASSLYAQEDSIRKNAFEIPLYRFEVSTPTFYDKLEPKFFVGLSYERMSNKWSFNVTWEYGNNLINDYCGQCSDVYEGRGRLIEFNSFLGFRYILGKKPSRKFKLFIGNDIYYSRANYKGNFSGGISGNGYQVNSYYNSLGVQQKFGLDYYPTPFLRFSASTWLRAGMTHRFHALSNLTPIWNLDYGWTVVQCRVAFVF